MNKQELEMVLIEMYDEVLKLEHEISYIDDLHKRLLISQEKVKTNQKNLKDKIKRLEKELLK